MSKCKINNIWQGHNLKPHRVTSFMLSRDPEFLEKSTDVVDAYLNLPQLAVGLCVDEKSQIQALDRTQWLNVMRVTHRAWLSERFSA